MPLYTFILEFEGGTYLSQVVAQSFVQAPVAWADELVPGEIKGMRETSLNELRIATQGSAPVPLNGLQRAWCFSTLVRGRLALVHFVETSEPGASKPAPSAPQLDHQPLR
ncbi:hypothetical protein [Chitinolyticbacter meiyuanensis]|uniref:hypothetical protein n=1 Tax=Chitinolyticbacter meiyuanensis TaxID=682798 RepID=UPI0011E5E91E|nr:hypothetical protein [Chitinolyticbacter meiyuanensis]